MSQAFDYREILKTLNSIGYSNISAAELKVFKKDLNVLIKYECGNSTKENANSQLKREYDGIGHRLTTATAATTNQTKPKSGGIRQKEVEKLPKRSTAVVTEQKEKIDKDKQMKTTKTEQPPLTSPNDEKFPNRRQNVRGKTKPIGRIGIRNTPVDLYQKYKSDWEKFKRFIPGENSRDEVRREVRAKIQKQPPPKPLVYLYYENGHKYIDP